MPIVKNILTDQIINLGNDVHILSMKVQRVNLGHRIVVIAQPSDWRKLRSSGLFEHTRMLEDFIMGYTWVSEVPDDIRDYEVQPKFAERCWVNRPKPIKRKNRKW